MESRKVVFRETGVILAGEVLGVGLMYAVFALLGRFDRSVLLGGIIGGALAVANFFFMAVGVSLAADKAAGQDVKGGKRQVRLSYGARMCVIFAILFACVKGGLCNVFSAVLPLAFVRPVITVAEFFRK